MESSHGLPVHDYGFPALTATRAFLAALGKNPVLVLNTAKFWALGAWAEWIAEINGKIIIARIVARKRKIISPARGRVGLHPI